MRSLIITLIISVNWLALTACGKDVQLSSEDQTGGLANQASTSNTQVTPPVTDPLDTGSLNSQTPVLACPQNIGRVTLTYSYGGQSCIGNQFPLPVGYAPESCYPGYVQLSAPQSAPIYLVFTFTYQGSYGTEQGATGIQLPAGRSSSAIGSVNGPVESIRLAECQWNNQLVDCSCLVDFAIARQP
jgi:hypothetical protein